MAKLKYVGPLPEKKSGTRKLKYIGPLEYSYNPSEYRLREQGADPYSGEIDVGTAYDIGPTPQPPYTGDDQLLASHTRSTPELLPSHRPGPSRDLSTYTPPPPEPGLEQPSPLLDPVEALVGAATGGATTLYKAALGGMTKRGARELLKRVTISAGSQALEFPIVGQAMEAGEHVAESAGAGPLVSFITGLASGVVPTVVAQAVIGNKLTNEITRLIADKYTPDEIAKRVQPRFKVSAKLDPRHVTNYGDDGLRYAQYWREKLIESERTRKHLSAEEHVQWMRDLGQGKVQGSFDLPPQPPSKRIADSAETLERAEIEAERMRQSPMGGELLKKQLEQQRAEKRVETLPPPMLPKKGQSPQILDIDTQKIAQAPDDTKRQLMAILAKESVERTQAERGTLVQWGIPPDIQKVVPGPGVPGESGAAITQALEPIIGAGVGAGVGAAVSPEDERLKGAAIGAGVGAGLALGGRYGLSKLKATPPPMTAQQRMAQRGVYVPTDLMTKWSKLGLTHKQYASKAENIHLDVPDMEDVGEAVIKVISVTQDPILLNDAKRIMWRMFDWMRQEDFDPTLLKPVLEKYGYTPRQLSEELVAAASFSGQTLSQLSKVMRALQKAIPDDPEIQAQVNALATRHPLSKLYTALADVLGYMDNKTRMLAVGQTATAQRNMIGQAGRYGIDLWDRSIQSTLDFSIGNTVRAISGDKLHSFADSFASTFDNVFAIWARMSKKERAKLESILSEYPDVKASLLTAPVHDAVAYTSKVAGAAANVDKAVTDIVMFMNRTQEYLWRKAAFHGQLRTLARDKGYSLETLADMPKDQLSDILGEATNHALEMTFARGPQGALGKVYMDVFSNLEKYKIVPSLILRTTMPYPRFYMQSLKFIADFSPYGLVRNGLPKALKGDWKGASSDLSKAMIGSFLFYQAHQIRNSEYAGEKWWQVKADAIPEPIRKTLGIKTVVDGKQRYMDFRAFAPYSTYLFLSEFVDQYIRGVKPKTMNQWDIMQAALSINRMAGTGLSLFDFVSGRRVPTDIGNALVDIAGQWLSRITVPLRTPKDLAASLGDLLDSVEEHYETPIKRDTITLLQDQGIPGYTRESKWMGPFLENVPFVGQMNLNPVPQLTQSGPYRRLYPGLRQLTGLTMVEKDRLRQEIDRLNVQAYPQTGDPTLNRLITQGMGVILERDHKRILASLDQRQLSFEERKEALNMILGNIRTGVTNQTAPLYYTQKLKDMPDNDTRAVYITDLVKRGRLGKRMFGLLTKAVPIQFSPKQLEGIRATMID